MIELEEGPDGKLQPKKGAEIEDHITISRLAHILGMDPNNLRHRAETNEQISIRVGRKGYAHVAANDVRKILNELVEPDQEGRRGKRSSYTWAKGNITAKGIHIVKSPTTKRGIAILPRGKN